ncbi:hypothetical protein BC830DRAFT_504135 [Chytriomyces sp. MP71]|nr:hypothetical protein BC830DRAFT_504135 [Chytriomyces sp. MP71]
MPPSNAKTLAAKQTAKSGNPSPLNPTASLKPKAGPVSSAVARSNAKLTDSNQNIKASTTATMEPQQDQVLSLNAKNIADIKANIQAMEKAYKDSLALRRIQNAPVSIFNEFSNESGSPDMAGLLGIGVGSEDLLAKVTKDLISMKALKERNTQEKMKQAEERDALLSEAIQHTRSYYKAKQECMEAGPKLLYSFFNSFGNIVHIESLDSEAGQTYAVFSEPGVIE